MSFTKLRGTEDLPVIAFKDAQHLQTQMGELRKAALSFLASALGDDSLAAEYILLQLISRSEPCPSESYCRIQLTSPG